MIYLFYFLSNFYNYKKQLKQIMYNYKILKIFLIIVESERFYNILFSY